MAISPCYMHLNNNKIIMKYKMTSFPIGGRVVIKAWYICSREWCGLGGGEAGITDMFVFLLHCHLVFPSFSSVSLYLLIY